MPEPATPKRGREAPRPARVSDVRSPPKKRLKEAEDTAKSSDAPSEPVCAPSDAQAEPPARANPPPPPLPPPPAPAIPVDESDDAADDTDGGVAAVATRARHTRYRTMLSAEQKRAHFQERYKGLALVHEIIPYLDVLTHHVDDFAWDEELAPCVRAAAKRGRAILDKYYQLTDDSIIYRIAMSELHCRSV